MKKKWLILSVLLLMIQAFMPLVTLAEVVSNDRQPSNIKLINLATEEVILNPEEVNMTLTVATVDNKHEGEEILINLEGFTFESSIKEDITNESGEKIGWYQKNTTSLVIHTENTQSEQFVLYLKGALTNQTTLSQTIGFSTETSRVSQQVKLLEVEETINTTEIKEEIDTTKDVEKETDVTYSVAETEGSTTESLEKIREPMNITDLLEGDTFFKDVLMAKKNEDNTGFITIDGEKTPVTLGEAIKLTMNYKLPEEVRKKMKARDFYEVQLPGEIAIYTPINGELISSENDNYGTYTIDTYGKIRIEFNENVESHHEVGGEFIIESSLQQGEMKEYGENLIKFPFVEESPEISVYLQKDKNNAVNKKGELNRKNNPTHINWDVDINLNYGIHHNAVITENFPKGTIFESVEVKELTVGLNGSTQEGAVIPSSLYTVSSDGTQIKFKEKMNRPYRLRYKTKIEESSKPGEIGGWINYDNGVTMTSAEDIIGTVAQATIGAQYKKMLSKNITAYNPDKQMMSWEIEYNHIESEITKEKAFLQDTFEGNMVLDKSSFEVRKIKFDDNGNPISNGELLTEGVDYQFIPNGNGFNIQFLTDVNYATTITYNTLIDEEVHGSDETHFYQNHVEDGNGNKGTDQNEAYQRVVAKWYSDINYRNKTVDWHIRLNTNKYEMNDFVLSDTMSTGLNITGNPARIEIRDFTTGHTLREGVDYLFEYEKESKEFEVSFIGDYVKTSNVFEITYQTIFDTPKLHDVGEEYFSNDAKGTWKTKDGKIVTNTSNSSFEPRPEDQSDGFKHGNYNAKNKEIEWQLGINYNRQDLGDVTIVDELQSNQVYVPGSLKIYRYTITDSGEVVPGERVVGEELLRLISIKEPAVSKGTLVPKDPLEKNELVVKIKDVGVEDQYVMTFNTSLKDQVIHTSSTYHNVALVQASKVGPDNFKIEGDVSIANGDSFVEKSGLQDSEGFLQWKVTINPSQSTIYNPIITDKPSSNQTIVEDSIKLYELDTDDRGNLKRGRIVDKNLYKISIETGEVTYEQQLKITFTDEKIERAYLLEYKSSLFLENHSGEYATNKVQLNGDNQELITEQKSKQISVRMSSGSGTASGKQGKYVIQKSSEEYGNTESKPLVDTVFEMFDKTGGKSFGQAKTDIDGQAVFDKLPLGDYILKEIEASDGYQISEELQAGIPVTVTRLTSTGVEKLALKNERIIEKISISTKKTWDDENNQDGIRPSEVEMQLYKNNKKLGNPVKLHSGNKWFYEWGNLDKTDKGELVTYHVEEVSQFDDYTLTKEEHDQKGNFSFTNTHTPATTTISGNKTWDDKDNQDGLRPDFIIVNVLKNGQEYVAKKVKPDKQDKWHYEFKDLPKYDRGKEIKYTVTENEVTGYTPTVTDFNVKNIHTPDKTSYFVSKAWDDEDNQDGKRSKLVLVQLYADGKEHGKPVELNEANNWQHQWTNLYDKNQGVKVRYEVKELTQTPGYTTKINDTHPGIGIITNSHIPEKVTISGEKEWDDENNQDGVRPDSIVVNVLQNGQEYLAQKVRPDANGRWGYEFTDLPKYYKGQELKYSVSENEILDYTPTIVGYDITNTHTPDKTSLFVSKAWDDENNQDGKRPKSIAVQLYGDKVEVGRPVELNEANNWQYQWTDLADKKEGQFVKYTVKETTEISGYLTEINESHPGNVIITNSHTPEKIKISGKKTWDDKNNQDGVRPDSIVVNVLQNGQEFVAKKIKPDVNGEWKYEFKDLPKYDKGQEINYSVTENQIADYTPKVTEFDITNAHTPGKTSYFVSKAWDDESNQDGKRPKSVFVQLYGDGEKVGNLIELNDGNHWQYQWIDLDEKKQGEIVEYTVKEVTEIPGYTTTVNNKNPGNTIITNSHVPEVVKVSGKKTWNDDHDQDGVRPKTIVVNVLQNGQEYLAEKVMSDSQEVWSYEFNELPKYKNGELNKYSVTENNVTDYTNEVTGYDIINSHAPGKTSYFVSKAWDDENDQDSKRPKSIFVQLYGDNEVVEEKVELNEGNNWQYQWTELDEKDQGKKIKYEVKEITEVAGYRTTLNHTNTGTTIITNTHIPETTTVAGVKTWDDNNDQDGVRPDNIVVTVLSNGQEFVSKKIKPDTDGNWKYEFTDLPKYEKGQETIYSVTENKITDYTPTVTGYDIKNSHTPGKTSYFVSKAWNDENNQDGKRPNSISMQLYKDGKKEGEAVELNTANNWQYRWTELEEKDQGREIAYSVKEVTQVESYTTAINTENPGNSIVTNSHTPETIKVRGTKTWEDNNNQDGRRPETIIVNLLQDNVEFLAMKVKGDGNQWQYDFEDVPKYHNGEEINYTVTENTVEHYAKEITGFDIINSYTPGKQDAMVSKAWDDNDNQDGKRAKEIVVQLFANNQKHGEAVKFSQENQWQHNWQGLDIYKEGQKINYEVKEITEVLGYTTTVDNSNLGNIIITNTHEPERINVSGNKTWEDNNNRAGERPTNIQINLLKNGQTYMSEKVSGSDKEVWEYTFNDLPKYHQGQEIIYTITENTVKNYSTSIKDFDVTNIYTPNKTSVTVTKFWNDNQNKAGKRAKEIKVQLYKNGVKEGESTTLSSQTNWTTTWDNLPNKEKGKEITYEVKEITKLANYQTIVNNQDIGNIVITNTYTETNKEITNQGGGNKKNTESKIPQFGEVNDMWLLILGILLIGGTSHLYSRRKRSS